jgi:hypothetical protein
MRIRFSLISLAGVPLLALALLLAEDEEKSFSPYVDTQGNLLIPNKLRTSLSHLGTYVVPDEKSESFGFHDVYTQASTVKQFRATEEWPDGAVIVKELRKMTSVKMTTGKASYATDLIGWFIMVKDNKGRFKDNPHWDKGWGWGLFMKEDPRKNVSKGFTASCMGCHIPAKIDDWVFIEGYPALKKS